MTFRFAFKTSFGHLQDVLARCLACLRKTSLRHLVDVFWPTGLYEDFQPGHRNLLCDEVFIWNILCRLCQDPAKPQQDEKGSGFTDTPLYISNGYGSSGPIYCPVPALIQTVSKNFDFSENLDAALKKHLYILNTLAPLPTTRGSKMKSESFSKKIAP